MMNQHSTQKSVDYFNELKKERHVFLTFLKKIRLFFLGQPLKQPRVLGAKIVGLYIAAIALFQINHWVILPTALLLSLITHKILIPGLLLLFFGEPKNEHGKVLLKYRLLMIMTVILLHAPKFSTGDWFSSGSKSCASIFTGTMLVCGHRDSKKGIAP